MQMNTRIYVMNNLDLSSLLKMVEEVITEASADVELRDPMIAVRKHRKKREAEKKKEKAAEEKEAALERAAYKKHGQYFDIEQSRGAEKGGVKKALRTDPKVKDTAFKGAAKPSAEAPNLTRKPQYLAKKEEEAEKAAKIAAAKKAQEEEDALLDTGVKMAGLEAPHERVYTPEEREAFNRKLGAWLPDGTPWERFGYDPRELSPTEKLLRGIEPVEPVEPDDPGAADPGPHDAEAVDSDVDVAELVGHGEEPSAEEMTPEEGTGEDDAAALGEDDVAALWAAYDLELEKEISIYKEQQSAKNPSCKPGSIFRNAECHNIINRQYVLDDARSNIMDDIYDDTSDIELWDDRKQQYVRGKGAEIFAQAVEDGTVKGTNVHGVPYSIAPFASMIIEDIVVAHDLEDWEEIAYEEYKEDYIKLGMPADHILPYTPEWGTYSALERKKFADKIKKQDPKRPLDDLLRPSPKPPRPAEKLPEGNLINKTVKIGDLHLKTTPQILVIGLGSARKAFRLEALSQPVVVNKAFFDKHGYLVLTATALGRTETTRMQRTKWEQLLKVLANSKAPKGKEAAKIKGSLWPPKPDLLFIRDN